MIRPWVPLAAAIIASPALYAGFVADSLPMDQALGRFLLAVLACAVGGAVLRTLVDGLGDFHGEASAAPKRRRDDVIDGAVRPRAEGE